MIIVANLVALGHHPGLGDARRPDRPQAGLPVGALGSAALIWPFIWAVSQGNIVLVFVVGILLSGVVYPAYGGVGFALFAEQFGTRVRMSGVAVGTQFGFALGGFAPSIAAVLAGPRWRTGCRSRRSAAPPRCVATIAALTMRETDSTPMHALGKSD